MNNPSHSHYPDKRGCFVQVQEESLQQLFDVHLWSSFLPVIQHAWNIRTLFYYKVILVGGFFSGHWTIGLEVYLGYMATWDLCFRW